MRTAYAFFSGLVLGAVVMLMINPSRAEARRRELPPPPVAAEATTPSAAALTIQLPSGLVMPVLGVDASQLHDNFYGVRSGGRMHEALDIMAPRGTPVLAAVDGKVRKLFTSKAGGITIYETDPAEQMIYYYAHLDRYANDLIEGKLLRRGDVIGYVGTTGNSAIVLLVIQECSY